MFSLFNYSCLSILHCICSKISILSTYQASKNLQRYVVFWTFCYYYLECLI
uniref:Uncharacterized protein n=1 Tax=Arundo donax TaxID=35708 RepID=A0A0A9BZM9_ARUDO